MFGLGLGLGLGWAPALVWDLRVRASGLGPQILELPGSSLHCPAEWAPQTCTVWLIHSIRSIEGVVSEACSSNGS